MQRLRFPFGSVAGYIFDGDECLVFELLASKFVQEAVKSSSEEDPPRTVYGISAGIRRSLAEKKTGDVLNLLSTLDNRQRFGGN